MVIACLKILGNDGAVATQEFVVPHVPPKRKRPHNKSPVKPSADKSQKVQVQTEHFVTVFETDRCIHIYIEFEDFCTNVSFFCVGDIFIKCVIYPT